MLEIFSLREHGLNPKLAGLDLFKTDFTTEISPAISSGISPGINSGKIPRTPLGLAHQIVPETIAAILQPTSPDLSTISGLPTVDLFSEPWSDFPVTDATDPLTGEQFNLQALPLSFIANQGQFAPTVHSVVKGAKQAIAFTPDKILFNSAEQWQSEKLPNLVQLTFPGANQNPQINFLDPLPGVSNFIKGQDPENWVINVPNYTGLIYQNLYDGIDLKYSSLNSELKSDFIVHPGADPKQIRLQYSGVENIRIREDGALVLITPFGELVENAPIVYQEINGEKIYIPAQYILTENYTVRFEIGAYNPNYTLVIDPTIQYSSYIGGSLRDSVSDIVVNRAGNIIVTGSTNSTDFPTQFGFQNSFGGGAFDGDAFVTKLSLDGSAVVFSTFLGGSGNETAKSIAVDNAGDIYIGGITTSANFPVLNAFQSSSADGIAPEFGGDAFITKLSEKGNALIYSTYLGGSGVENVGGIAVDNTGSVSVTGTTRSADFPVQNAFDNQRDGDEDAFISKFSADGSRLVFSTYLGGSDREVGEAIVTDNGGNIYVTGATASNNLPVVAAVQPNFAGQSDAFVGKFGPNGNLIFLTYLGGGDVDQGLAIALDQSRNVYVTGKTGLSDIGQPFAASEPPNPQSARNFPLVNPFQVTFFGGYDDAFVTKLSEKGDALLYSTYLGGNGTDLGQAIAVDNQGSVYLTGTTNSTDFPRINALQPIFGGNRDAFVLKLAPDGKTLRYSSYIGGGDIDAGQAIALDLNNNVYLAGFTNSNNFPTQQPFQGTLRGVGDGFIVKLSPETGPVPNQFESYSQFILKENLSLLSLFYDEKYYLANNPDVAQAVAAGAYPNGLQHYLLHGQSERRNPSRLFNENLYLAQNPDVAQAVAAGGLRSGFEHFNRFGLAEGRDRRLVLFDQVFYLATNPDVAAAVAGGAFKSAYEHYITAGQFERRNPNLFFDEQFYVESNPDVAEALAAGVINSGFEHFAFFGERQRRRVSPGYDESFYLANNPDVAAAVAAGGLRSGFDHYIRFGFREGRPGIG